MAALLNARDTALQAGTVSRYSRAPKTYSTSAAPWTSLYTLGTLSNIIVVDAALVTNPFGGTSKLYTASGTGSLIHNTTSIVLSSSIATSASYQFNIYIKDDGLNSALGISAVARTADALVNRNYFTAVRATTGEKLVSTVESGWVENSFKITNVGNGWLKIVAVATFTKTASNETQLLVDFKLLNTAATQQYDVASTAARLYLYAPTAYIGIADEVIGDTWFNAASNSYSVWNGEAFVAFKATDGITIENTKQYIALVSDNAGTVSSYAASGTTIKVYEGSTALTYVTSNPVAGQFTLGSVTQNPVSAITLGTFSGTGTTIATIGNHSALTQDAVILTYPINAVRSNGVSVSLSTSQSLAKNKTGTAGNNGTNGTRSATVYLYQWKTTQPAAPTGTSTYTWSTDSNGTYSLTATDGWQNTVPTNPGTPGIVFWVATKTFSETTTASTTTIIAWGGDKVTSVTANSYVRTVGVQYAKPTVFQWAASIPAAPIGSPVYTWATGVLSATPVGWDLTPATSPSPGFTLWSAEVSLIDSIAATTTTVNWANAQIKALSVAGTQGPQGNIGNTGNTGTTGNSFRIAYAKFTATPSGTASATGNVSATATTVTTTGNTSFPATATWGNAEVWSGATSVLAVGESLYQIDGIYSPVSNQTVWNYPYLSNLKVGNLSAITANTGALTVSDAITVGNTGHIKGGQTAYNTGSGFFLGYATDGYKFSIGSGANMLTWNGTTLSIPGGAITANSITTSKLLVTSKGEAINDDPGFEDPSAWVLAGTGTAFASGTGTILNAVGTAYLFNSTGASNGMAYSRSIIIDPAKTYLLTANIYAATGNDRNMYIFVDMYDGSGAQVTGATTGWGGTLSGYVFGAVPPSPGSFTRQGGQFGAGTNRPIPSNVRTAKVGVWFQYSFAGTTSVQQACQDLRLERVNDASLIVDGTITASKIQTGLLQADNVLTRGLTVRDAAGNIIFSAGTPLTATYADAALKNSSISINSNGVLSGAGGGSVTIGGLGYTGDLNASSDLVLTGAVGVSIAGNKITKTSASGAWDAGAYGRDGNTGGAYASAIFTEGYVMFGLNTDPALDSSYTSLDFAIYSQGGNVQVYESNVNKASAVASPGDVFTIVYDGRSVYYLRNGSVFYQRGVTVTGALYFDCSIQSPGGGVSNCRFGPVTTNANTNLLDARTWVNGSNGSQPGFNANGISSTGSNDIVYDTLPSGAYGSIWRAKSGSAVGTSAEGGWDTSSFPVDHTKMYRFSVWLRSFTSNGGTANGEYFFGVGGSTVNAIANGSVQGNPYFFSGPRSTLANSTWYLLVGYVYSSTYTGSINMGGVYKADTGQLITGATSYRWVANQNVSTQRVYQYYTTTNTNYQDFWAPRVDVCDGTEPSLDELLAVGAVSARNKITSAKASVFIDNAAINSAQIGSLSVGVLSTTMNGGASSGRIVMETNKMTVFDASNNPRVKIGYLL